MGRRRNRTRTLGPAGGDRPATAPGPSIHHHTTHASLQPPRFATCTATRPPRVHDARRQNNTGHSPQPPPSRATRAYRLRLEQVEWAPTAPHLGRQDRVLRFAQRPRARRVGGTRSRRLGLGSGRWDLFVADACGRLHFFSVWNWLSKQGRNGLQGVCIP